jgi:hypothetical protein
VAAAATAAAATVTAAAEQQQHTRSQRSTQLQAQAPLSQIKIAPHAPEPCIMLGSWPVRCLLHAKSSSTQLQAQALPSQVKHQYNNYVRQLASMSTAACKLKHGRPDAGTAASCTVEALTIQPPVALANHVSFTSS